MNRFWKNLIVFYTILWVAVAAIVGIVSVAMYIHQSLNLGFKNENENKGETYEYTRISKDGVHSGLVSLPNSLKGENFITYTEDNSHANVLISNFGNDGYQCTGTCFCDYSEERRSTAVLKSGIRYLLVASSLITAYNLAVNQFSSDCESKYSDVCAMESVSAEVEECNRIAEMKEKETEEGHKLFDCYGQCLPNQDLAASGPIKRIIKDFGCSKLSHQGEVLVKESELNPKYAGNEYSQYTSTAADRYIAGLLDEFCSKNSEHETKERFATSDSTRKAKTKRAPGKKKRIESQGIKKKDVTVSLCVSQVGRTPNPTVTCVPKF